MWMSGLDSGEWLGVGVLQVGAGPLTPALSRGEREPVRRKLEVLCLPATLALPANTILTNGTDGPLSLWERAGVRERNSPPAPT